MISDTLFEAVYDIKEFQRIHPDLYSARSKTIEIVKSVMSGLMERLQRYPSDYPLDYAIDKAKGLSPERAEWYRVTCEANIARWVERLRLFGPVSNEEIVAKLDDAIKQQETLLAEIRNSSDNDNNMAQPTPTNSERLNTLFPIYDRGDEPLVTVEQLKRDVKEVIESGDELPYMAFVSGPEMNLRVEFNDFDADTDREIVSLGLIELIRKGADQVLLVADVWFRGEESTRWHGVMILEARPDGDTLHVAEFEGRTTLGPWEESSPDDGGNLSRLFERAGQHST